ncbi:MAG: apolipoprotein N-acyltransferase [Pseudomonadota bacterium]|jgi:apolipoprotein N-acyltransferase
MRVLLLLTIASCLTCLGIVFPSLWFAVFPGLALFFTILRTHVHRVWSAALCGLIFGCSTGGAGTIWFWDTLPLTFLGINDPIIQTIAVGMTWSYVAISLGLPIVGGAIAIWLCRSSLWFPILAPFIWMLCEVGRMWSFALTTWGPQSLFGPHFSAASVGYAITESQILSTLAHPFGIDALNLCVATVAACLAVAPSIITSSAQRTARAALVGTALILLIIPAVSTQTPRRNDNQTLRFAIISENIQDVRDFSTHYDVTQLLSEVAAAVPPVDVVVLPEEFSLTSIFWSKKEAAQFVADHFGTRDVLILNTRNDLYPEEERNQVPENKKLVYDSTAHGELGRYIKQMVMPLGEYAPSFTQTFFSLLDDHELQLYLHDLAAGPPISRDLYVSTFRNVRIGGLLCSDMLSPHLYRALVRDHGARLLVNLSNHFWFHGSKPLYWKTIQIARVHAIQNRAPLLVSNNVAPAFVLDKHGQLIAQATWGKREVMYVQIPVEAQT